MATINLSTESHSFLQSLGWDSSTFHDETWKRGMEYAKQQLNNTLTTGAPIDAAAVKYLVDYYNDDLDDDQFDSFRKWLYRPHDGSPPRVGDYLDSGRPITKELAPLLANLSFCLALNSDPTEEENAQHFANNLAQSLQNAAAVAPPAEPPAEVISALGRLNSNVELTLGNIAVTKTARAWSQYYAESHLLHAGQTQRVVDPTMVQAYVDIDKERAKTWFNGQLLPMMKSDGAISPELMEAYRKLNPKGPGGPSVATTDLAPPPPEGLAPAPEGVSGWACLALKSLSLAIDAHKPVNATMLANLAAEDPWSAAYVRWRVLSDQASTGVLYAEHLDALKRFSPAAAAEVCVAALDKQTESHKNLNIDHLTIVRDQLPQEAVRLCDDQFRDALQPTNKFLAAEPGATPPLQARVRVDLNGMGVPRPVVPDVLTLLVNGEPGTPPRTVPLTPSDISRGYVDVVYTPAAGEVIVSRFEHGSGDALVTSPESTALTHPQDPTKPARALDQAAWEILNGLNPSLANEWRRRFTNAGLLPGPQQVSRDVITNVTESFLERAKGVESQLKQLVVVTQQKNEQMAKLNVLMGALNNMAAAIKAGTDPSKKVMDEVGEAKFAPLSDGVNSALAAADIAGFATSDGKINGTVTWSDLDGYTKKLKSMLDSLNSFQQADLIKLQSLTNAVNQSYEAASNVEKKRADRNASILSNMR
jgi:hypothetical protein